MKMAKKEKVLDLKPEKITDEQLEKVQKTVNNMNRSQLEIGSMELRKHDLLHGIAGLRDELTLLQKEFEKEYGTFDIDIQSGAINYTKENEYHHSHEHQNSMISGVFYINADENDSIRFYKAGYQQIKPEIKEYNLWNSTSWYVPARTGKLILFPSSLPHSVDHKKGDNVRISLSFNVFIKGTVGDITNITKLDL